jgi:hypothetical protein
MNVLCVHVIVIAELNTHTTVTLVKQNAHTAARRTEHMLKKRAADGRGEARRPV